jgi:tetratricopeptide (TPR) repeat protein
MPDPLRHDEDLLASETGRETRIEELLLAGLDHYFNGQHELAISVWTRVLFLDRSHARARAYIERARGAIAERHREGEELLQTGVAAFDRGDAVDARRLLTSAVERGISSDEALALLDRLDRLAPAGDARDAGAPVRRERLATNAGAAISRKGISPATLFLVLAIGLLTGALVVIAWSGRDLPWRPSSAPATIGAGSPRLEPLPVPSPAEVSLSRARTFYSKGRVRDALAALDAIRPGDPFRAQADELRITIQRQLLATARSASRAATPGGSSSR